MFLGRKKGYLRSQITMKYESQGYQRSIPYIVFRLEKNVN